MIGDDAARFVMLSSTPLFQNILRGYCVCVRRVRVGRFTPLAELFLIMVTNVSLQVYTIHTKCFQHHTIITNKHIKRHQPHLRAQTSYFDENAQHSTAQRRTSQCAY